MQSVLIYYLKDKLGPAEIVTHSVNADEMIERDPQRYVRVLPPTAKRHA